MPNQAKLIEIHPVRRGAARLIKRALELIPYMRENGRIRSKALIKYKESLHKSRSIKLDIKINLTVTMIHRVQFHDVIFGQLYSSQLPVWVIFCLHCVLSIFRPSCSSVMHDRFIVIWHTKCFCFIFLCDVKIVQVTCKNKYKRFR